MSKALVIVIIVLVLLGVFFFGRGDSVEAPEMNAPVTPSPSTVEEEPVVDETATPEIKEFIVNGVNFSFDPKTISVKKGDRVKITFKSTQGFHDFKIDEYGVATKQLRSPDEEVLEFTADKTGSFEYYCSVGTHRAMGMVGTLIVAE